MNMVVWMLAGGILAGSATNSGFQRRAGHDGLDRHRRRGRVLRRKNRCADVHHCLRRSADFNSSALLFAAAVAAAFLAVGNLVHNRWGV